MATSHGAHRRGWLAAVFIFCVTISGAVAAPNCTSLRQGSGTPRRIVIDKPGNYCLTQSIHIDGQYWPVTPEGHKLFSDDTVIMELKADDITLDFQGHSATSDARLNVGITTPRGPDHEAALLPKKLPAIVPKNLTIKNGTIRVSRHGMALEVYGIGPQEVLANIVTDATEEEFAAMFVGRTGGTQGLDPQVMPQWIADENRERADLRKTFMPNAVAYPIRNLHIENMRIRSQDYAVVLQGAGTVIRDSVIESDSGTALWLYGPNATIENNVFIVHCLSKKQSLQGRSQCQEMDAPIRLMHGDGAIIRNNRFVLKENAHKRVISLFDTGAITVEGNTYTGLDTLQQAIQSFRGPGEVTGSTINRVDNSPWAKLRAWF